MEEVEADPTYSDEKSQFYKDRLDDLNTEKQAKLETLSQNRKDLQKEVASIKQTLEKFLYKDAFLTERIRTFFCEQGITIISILTSLFLGKVVGYVAEHAWALTGFVVGYIGVWLMQRVKND